MKLLFMLLSVTLSALAQSQTFEKHLENADAYIRKGNYAAAIESYTAAIKLDPQSAYVYTNRGIAYLNTNQIDLAIQDFTQVIHLDPKDKNAYGLRGIAYRSKNEYGLSLKDLDMDIRLDPKDASSLYYRSLLHYSMGEYEKAASDCKILMTLSPDNGDFYFDLIGPLIRLRRLEEAWDVYKKFKESGLISQYSAAGWDWYRDYLDCLEPIINNNYEEALERLVKIINLFGNDGDWVRTQRYYIDMLNLQGIVMEKLNMIPEVQVLYEQSLLINEHQPDLEAALQRLNESSAIAVKTDHSIPDITIITPGNTNIGMSNENTSVQIVGRAKDPSGIEFVKLNGVAVEKLEEDGLFITHINLVAGENTWTFTASDKNGNVATKTMAMNVTAADVNRGTKVVGNGDGKSSLVVDSNPTFHAILIAEQNYNDPKIPDLQNPKNDALELGKILEEKYGFASNNIDTLFDRSREEIMAAVVRKSSSLTSNESLIIFYAGHGIAEKDKFGDVDGYWIPSSATYQLNASYISTDDINKAIKRSNAKHILVIADACFSGAMTRALPPDAAREVTRQYIIPSRKVMASGNLEPVPDNSKFILYLKKRLTENTEKYLTAQDLFSSFRTAVMSNSETIPQYAAIKNVGDEGGEFIFIRKD
jgi:tetratricopeptide (TPR) repeat protein